jgi:hypothetical protein
MELATHPKDEAGTEFDNFRDRCLLFVSFGIRNSNGQQEQQQKAKEADAGTTR